MELFKVMEMIIVNVLISVIWIFVLNYQRDKYYKKGFVDGYVKAVNTKQDVLPIILN